MKNITLLFIGLVILALMAFTTKQNNKNLKSSIIWQDTTMVFVQGGSFNMGSVDFPNEKPVHSVVVKDFYIDKYEVTVEQYRAYCEATGTTMPEPPSWGFKDNYPMVKVSWNDAVVYAKWAGKRLPTEAEWEYAAKGGQKKEAGLYAGGNYALQVAWFKNNAPQSPQPVGLKSPNALNIYDMSGNVWEWVSDFYGPYSFGKQTDPQGQDFGINRSMRGGSWFDGMGTVRVANRHYYPPSFGSHLIGFRLVKDK